MKTLVQASRYLGAQGLLLVLAAGCATPSRPGGTAVPQNAGRPVVVTGSYIPRSAASTGVEESPANLCVLDQADIERSGASSLSEVLRKRIPSIR